MKVVYGIGPLAKARITNAVVAIGVFDAVHRGHQKVIGRAVRAAHKINGTSVVLTFHPHPVSVLYPEKFSAYVLPLSQRLVQIAQCGVDVCCVVDFTAEFAHLSAEDFVRRILVETLHVRQVVVGDDFHFGRARQGDFNFLKSSGQRLGFSVHQVKTLKYKSINIKTKFIKERVAQGDLPSLKRFLGRPYSLSSVVERGRGVGRKLGYPTANLRKENVIILPGGIYIVRIIFKNTIHPGLFYIGSRPSFGGQKDVSLEAHILDRSVDLYGQMITVEFFKKLRNDRTFSDEKKLIIQMDRDAKAARLFFKKSPSFLK